MRKQKTFESLSKAMDFVEHLSNCFDIKKLKLFRIFNKKWRWYDWRLIVEYE